MLDFTSNQIYILLAGAGLVGFGILALLGSFLWPRKQQTPAPVPVKADATEPPVKGDIVVSIVPAASSAVLSTSVGGTLLVSRRDAFAKSEAVVEEPAAIEAAVLDTSEESPVEAVTASSSEAPAAVRLEDLSMLEDLYAEMFALRSSIGELARDIQSLRVRLEEPAESARAPSKRRERSRNMQVQAAA